MILEQNTEGKQMSTVEASQMTSLLAEIQQLAKIEETSWRQKSRCLWLKEGDRNTKYFQKIANSNRRSNCIDKLLVDYVVIEDKETIKKETLEFFEGVYTELEEWRPTIMFEGIASIIGKQ